jgi:hypothetical protein
MEIIEDSRYYSLYGEYRSRMRVSWDQLSQEVRTAKDKGVLYFHITHDFSEYKCNLYLSFLRCLVNMEVKIYSRPSHESGDGVFFPKGICNNDVRTRQMQRINRVGNQ